MKPVIELDEAIPAPGEPLTPHIHETNQKLLTDDLAARTERAQTRLSGREQRRLYQRYKRLWRLLNRVNWNALIRRRWDTYQEYEKARLLFLAGEFGAVAAGKAAAARGRKLNTMIERYQRHANEFESIGRRLHAHDQIVAYEAEEAENLKAFRKEAKVWEDQIRAVFRQSLRLHHAGYDSKGNYFCHIPQIERIIFREDRVLYLLKVSSRNWAGKWRSALPYNVDVTDLTCDETLQNLSAHTNRVVTVVRSKNGQNLFYCVNRLDSPDGIPKRVLFSKVMPWYPTHDHAKTPWAAGVTTDRKTHWFNFEENPHMLIAGSTQSGKSNQINAIICTLVTMNSPAELRLVLIDNKGGVEFTHWQGIKHAARAMIKSADEVLPALEWAKGVMTRRLARFESIRAKNLSSYNGKVADDHRLPRLIIFIDEMATLLGLGELTTKIQNELRTLTSQGRAAGVHIVVCTQHSSADVLPGWIKTNMSLRIAGRMPSHHASMVILDTVSAALLPDVVGRMVFALGRYEIVAQTPYISDEEIARAVAISTEYPDPDNSEFQIAADAEPGELPAIIAPVLKFTEHDLIALALDRLDGKLSATRIHEIVGNEVVSLRTLRAMIADIIDSGEIEHEGMSYKLKPDRRNHILVPREQPNADDVSTADDETGSDDRSDEADLIESGEMELEYG